MALGSDGAASRAASDPGQAVDGQAPAAPQAPEELVEIQLRAILEATQTSAGAVCLFDQHQELLRLAIEVGLSDEGCRRLRSVRRGAAATWDMPLHSLLNRRVYLIESAAKNRYVPPLVDDVAKVRAVACVPLYNGSTPVGSLILIALAPRTFGERQIRLLEQPVRELVGNIVSMRKRVSTAAPQHPTRPSLSATAAPVPAAALAAGPTAPGVQTAPATPAPASSSIQAAVDRARAELDHLRARLAEAEEATSTERRRVEEVGQELATIRAERDRLSEALAARTSEIQPLSERVAALESALEEARRSEAALHADVEQARAAADGTQAAETLAGRLAELEATNQELRARVTELEAAEVAARAETERRVKAATEDAMAEAERRVKAAIEESTRLAATSASVETRTAALAAEADALRGRLADAEALHERERADAAARHAAALAEVEARADTAREEIAEWQRRYEAAESELVAGRDAAGSHGEQVEALARERAELDGELAAAREREADLVRRIAELEGQIERTQSEDVQLRNGFAHLESLLQTGIEAPAPVESANPPGDGDSSPFEVIELDEGATSTDDAPGPGLEVGGLVIEEIEASPPAESPPAEPSVQVPAPEGLLVLDTEDCWMAAAAPGCVTVLAPDGAPPEAHPERLLVNVGAPGALAALGALRAAGIGAPSFGCIRLPGQTRALLLGRVELASRPVDPDALLAGLQGAFARGTRVVTAGADVDALISLRQALARLGVSVSMAWDAKQASDLLAMVRPEVAIIDLDLPPKDGCALVARMGLIQAAPLTVVIPKATDTASTFAAAMSHAELGRATMPVKEVMAHVLASSLKAAAAPAPARR